ncbi:hypothetical protein B484DRAFT_448493 [Ochromonadaceae sp. CCMP2298]|nr:hypothetical protein B484DRAFT_448493 [Ochromonadaceae sp. CCMP2298]
MLRIAVVALLLAAAICRTDGFSYSKGASICGGWRTCKSTALWSTPNEGTKKKLSNRDKTLSNMIDSITYSRARGEPMVSLADDPLVPMVEAIVKSADMRKAASIKVLRVFQLTEVTQFMILIEGYNNRQNQAIALAIEDDVQESFDNTPFAKEGTAASGWILMDYGSIIAHIMTPQMSAFYKLEKKWAGAEYMDLTHLLVQDSPTKGIMSTVRPGEMDEDEAFWGDDAPDLTGEPEEEAEFYDADEEDEEWTA